LRPTGIRAAAPPSVLGAAADLAADNGDRAMWDPDNFPGADHVPWQRRAEARGTNLGCHQEATLTMGYVRRS
jgi:hypothetical protein